MVRGKGKWIGGYRRSWELGGGGIGFQTRRFFVLRFLRSGAMGGEMGGKTRPKKRKRSL